MNKEMFSEMSFFVDDMTHRNIELLKENQKLKEKVRAVNKGLRKVKERSINYKNRCFKLNKKIYELEEQLEDKLEDKKDYIKYKKNRYEYDVLIENKYEFKKNYDISVIDKPSLEDIMLIYIKGEK